MVEVLERGAALAEAASRTAGRRKRDMMAAVLVVRFGRREVDAIGLPPWTADGGQEKDKKTTDDDGRCSQTGRRRLGRMSSWGWSWVFGRGSRFRNTPAKRQEISGAPAAAQRSKNSLDVEPSSVERAESPISVGRPAAPSWSTDQQKLLLGYRRDPLAPQTARPSGRRAPNQASGRAIARTDVWRRPAHAHGSRETLSGR